MIAGIGFAMMAWRTALLRNGASRLAACSDPTWQPRGRDCPCPFCIEYHRILDRAVAARNTPGCDTVKL